MNATSDNPKHVAGIAPWLPWPLSAWSWWSEPVRAERLAALRIALGLMLLLDIVTNYAPHALAFYGAGGIGDPTLFDYYLDSSHTRWSLLRGVRHEAGLTLALVVWILAALWIVGNAGARILLRRKDPPPDDRTGAASYIWLFAFAWYVAGVWAIMREKDSVTDFAWILPLLGFSMASFFIALDLLERLLDPAHRVSWGFALTSLLVTGIVLSYPGMSLAEVDSTAWWLICLKPWQESEALVVTAMALWATSAFLLCIGFRTSLIAVAAWMLSLSFYNANNYLDNAGDTIRMCLLFYLMLCPCGVVWSIDAWFTKDNEPVYVHPWPICLIVVQMIFIYWMNGLYKLFGAVWRDGEALYWAMSDVALCRFAPNSLPMPYFMTQMMTWTTLAWEATFPFLLVFKWPRRIALLIGVLFHLGIFATMELGQFVPYALCMYVPLLPWERLSRRREQEIEVEIVEPVEAREGEAGEAPAEPVVSESPSSNPVSPEFTARQEPRPPEAIA